MIQKRLDLLTDGTRGTTAADVTALMLLRVCTIRLLMSELHGRVMEKRNIGQIH